MKENHMVSKNEFDAARQNRGRQNTSINDEWLADKDKILAAIRQSGLTLVKTADGYQLLKLGKISASPPKENQQETAIGWKLPPLPTGYNNPDMDTVYTESMLREYAIAALETNSVTTKLEKRLIDTSWGNSSTYYRGLGWNEAIEAMNTASTQTIQSSSEKSHEL